MRRAVFAIFIYLFASQLVYAENRIIAVVNNDAITQKDLNDFAQFVRIQLSQEYSGSELEGKVEEAKPMMLERMINEKLLLQEAKKQDIRIDESRVKARLLEVRQRYRTESEFTEGLSKQGWAQSDLEQRIREQFLIHSFIESKIRKDIHVNPKEVTDFYEANKNDIRTNDSREFEIYSFDSEDQARVFYYELRSGVKAKDLLVKYAPGFDSTVMEKGEGLRRDLEDAVFKLSPGEASEPIEVDRKYYVFLVKEIIPSRRLKLPEVQERIFAMVYAQKEKAAMDKWLDEARKKSYIKITPN